jgi:hypothetical protein
MLTKTEIESAIQELEKALELVGSNRTATLEIISNTAKKLIDMLHSAGGNGGTDPINELPKTGTRN